LTASLAEKPSMAGSPPCLDGRLVIIVGVVGLRLPAGTIRINNGGPCEHQKSWPSWSGRSPWFIGAGAMALAVAGTSSAGLVGVALAHGLALVVIIFAWGAISGGHVNPAVTFGLALAGRLPWIKAIRYWIAQLLGAVLASYLLLGLIGPR
jgi:hypothetical protein